MVVLQDIFVDELAQDALNQTDILTLSDTTTVVNRGANVIEHLIRHFLVVFNENFELSAGHNQIFVCERVGNVPPNRAKLTSILHDGVEETETEE